MPRIASPGYNIAEVNQKYAVGGSVKSSAKSFWEQMRTLMHDFSQMDQGMTIDGVYIAPENRFGVMETTLIADYTHRLERFMESQLTNFNILVDAEKQVSKMF